MINSKTSSKIIGLVMISAVVGIISVSVAPQAMAMNTPDFNKLPASPVINTVFQIEFVGNNDGSQPHDVLNIRAKDNAATVGTPLGGEAFMGSVTQCDAGSRNPGPANNGDGDWWELRTAATEGAGEPVQILNLGEDDAVRIPFGGNPGSNPVTITVIDSAADGDSPTSPTNGDQAYWAKLTGNADEHNSQQNAQYDFYYCGDDNGDGTTFATSSGVKPALPMAGELIPISTTALLLAGVSTSAFWLIPLVAVAGGAFALLRHNVNQKED